MKLLRFESLEFSKKLEISNPLFSHFHFNFLGEEKPTKLHGNFLNNGKLIGKFVSFGFTVQSDKRITAFAFVCLLVWIKYSVIHFLLIITSTENIFFVCNFNGSSVFIETLC